jgi:hypothetical protein
MSSKTSKIDFFKFARSELEDEVISKAPVLRNCDPQIEPLGFVFNPLYLYQPEIFVAVKYIELKDEIIAGLRSSLDESFVIVSVDQLVLAYMEVPEPKERIAA